MSDYVMLGEVRTYYERAGVGDPLVLLHPGGVDSRVFASLVPGLVDPPRRDPAKSLDRHGHHH